MLPLTKEELKSHHYAKKKNVTFVEKHKSLLKKIIVIYCHYTGKYRSAAHSICNLKLYVLNEIPVIKMSLRKNLNVLEKIQKSTKLFSVQ